MIILGYSTRIEKENEQALNMLKNIRFVAEIFDPKTETVSERIVIIEKEIKSPKNLMELGFTHCEQIDLLQKGQDALLKNQSAFLKPPSDKCPHCSHKLGKGGHQESDFHSVFTDHRVTIQRLKCPKCNKYVIPSVQSLFGSVIHPDLAKMQCELSSDHSYPETTAILTKLACGYRKINNQDRIRHNISLIGNSIASSNQIEDKIEVLVSKESAKELILNVDGGHVIDKNPDQRSFETLTAVIYQPKNVVINETTQKGDIIDKSCAASALSDGQVFMKQAVLRAAREQGMTHQTNITSLCDGAVNCWTIVDSLEPYVGSITRILDWFHITMKFKNLATYDATDLIDKAKWSLWHGDTDKAIIRLNKLLAMTKNEKEMIKIRKLITYVTNNKAYVVNYEDRKNKGLVFTSHMAESTVESLINQRCKAKQHMSWTREGLHALLQIRSAVLSTRNWAKQATSYIFKGLNMNPDVLKIC
jgi:hypothetical protein